MLLSSLDLKRRLLISLILTTTVFSLPIKEECRYDSEVDETVAMSHDIVKALQKRCVKSHSDVFQRVSSHLVKHKLEDFCNRAISIVVESLYLIRILCIDYTRLSWQIEHQRMWIREKIGSHEMRIIPSKIDLPLHKYHDGGSAGSRKPNSLVSEGQAAGSSDSESTVDSDQILTDGTALSQYDLVDISLSQPLPGIYPIMASDETGMEKGYDISTSGENQARLLLTLQFKELMIQKLHILKESAIGITVDFSTAEDMRISAKNNYGQLIEIVMQLFDHPIEFVKTISEYIRANVMLTLDSMAEVVNYHLADFNVKSQAHVILYTQLESFPQLVQPQIRSVYVSKRAQLCQTVLGFDIRRDPLMANRRLFTDASGLYINQPTILEHLQYYTDQLSYTSVAMQPRAVIGAEKVQDTYMDMYGREGSDVGKSKVSISAEDLRCNATGLAYSPTKCLFDVGWGSLTFTINTEEPFDATLTVSEMTEKLVQTEIDWGKDQEFQRPTPFVQPVSNGSADYDDILENVDSVYKTLNHPTPDLMYISPMVGNCWMMEKLGRSRQDQGTNRKRNPQLAPKLIAVPINPLIPPPFELIPDFSGWHGAVLEHSNSTDDSNWMFVQCSVVSAIKVLEKQGYELLQIDHNIALFGRKLGPATKFNKGPLRPEELWLQGWHCSPAADTFDSIKWKSGLNTDLLIDNSISPDIKIDEICQFIRRLNLPISDKNFHCDIVRQRMEEKHELLQVQRQQQQLQAQGPNSDHESAVQQQQTVDFIAQSLSNHGLQQTGIGENPYFFFRDWDLEHNVNELGKRFTLESNGRGRCLDDLGICECYIPYRGRFCEQEQKLLSFDGLDDKGNVPFKAALHYLVGDSKRFLEDFRKSLRLLWQNFNRKWQYPVIVFHDGLKKESKKYILESSMNPIWFAYVEDYTSIPKHLLAKIPQNDFAGYPLGYRGMCRFRSGPIFKHPILKGFDYAWTLDTDGYFPGDVQHNPIQAMHDGNFIYSYSHISRDQASQVQHFWEFTRLYLESRQIDKKATKLIRRITDALVMRDTFWHEWNRLLFMNDIELVRLDWFQSKLYQDYFEFLDSMGGFWLYRWGDHGIRTIGIAMHLNETVISKLNVPYSHQGACVCGSLNMKCKEIKPIEMNETELIRFRSEDASRSFKYECVELGEGEVQDEEKHRAGVVDEGRFWGGT